MCLPCAVPSKRRSHSSVKEGWSLSHILAKIFVMLCHFLFIYKMGSNYLVRSPAFTCLLLSKFCTSVAQSIPNTEFLTSQRGMMKLWRPFWYRNLYVGLFGFLCHLGQLEQPSSDPSPLRKDLAEDSTDASNNMDQRCTEAGSRVGGYWLVRKLIRSRFVAVKYGSNSHLFQTRVWGQGGVAHPSCKSFPLSRLHFHFRK